MSEEAAMLPLQQDNALLATMATPNVGVLSCIVLHFAHVSSCFLFQDIYIYSLPNEDYWQEAFTWK